MMLDGPAQTESAYAWLRLAATLLLASIGGVGMWSVAVVLPAVQAEFGVARGAASLPYTLTMMGFGMGGILLGRLVDRFGVVRPAVGAVLTLGLGYVAAALAPGLILFALAYGLLIGVGSAVTFGPFMADISHWFTRRRGIAVAISAAGNYFAGAIWSPIVQYFIARDGWRATHIGIGLFCVATMLPLLLILRRRAPATETEPGATGAPPALGALGLSAGALQSLLSIAGVACCVAMAMPQVHLVAYCGDLGYGVARGAQMLSVMLAFGVVSRIGSGFIADRIGGLATLLVGSALQGLALLLYVGFDGLASLYVISALFGLFQGGIVPSYAIIIRDFFPPREAGTRVGIVIFATVVGMAFGGWSSGAIFDLTGSYRAAFIHGVAWNALNVVIAAWLIARWRGRSTVPA